MEKPKSYHDLSQREKRALVFHLLYACDAFDNQMTSADIVQKFNTGLGTDIPDNCDEITLSDAICAQRQYLDEQYLCLLTNWRPERLGLATKLILRYAIWELHNTNTTTEIIINEAIELAKCFAEKDAFKFINGILDEIAKKMPNRASSVNTPHT